MSSNKTFSFEGAIDSCTFKLTVAVEHDPVEKQPRIKQAESSRHRDVFVCVPSKGKRKRVSESGDDSDDEDYEPSGSRRVPKKAAKKVKQQGRKPSEEI